MRHVVTFLFYHMWLFRKRHVFITIIQIIGPVAFTLLFTWNYHSLYTNETVDAGSSDKCNIYKRFSEKDLYGFLHRCSCEDAAPERRIITFYSKPKHASHSDQIIAHIKNITSLSNGGNESVLEFVKVDREEDITKFSILHHAQKTPDTYLGGIVFMNADPTLNTVNQTRVHRMKGQLNIKIRMASYMAIQQQSVLDHTLYYDPNYPCDYLPFLGLQIAIYRSYLELVEMKSQPGELEGEDEKDEAKVHKMKFNTEPFKFKTMTRYEHISNDVQPLYVVLAIAIVFSQVFMVMSIVRGPAFDKDTGFRAYLTMMGLRRSLYWTSWWLNEFMVRIIVSILQTVILFFNFNRWYRSLIDQGDYYVWFLFILTYNMASISFFIFMASFCKRGVIAPYIAATVWFLSYYFGDLFLVTQYLYADSEYTKLLMCLNPNSALIMGCSVMTRISGGVKWSDISAMPADNEMRLFDILAMLLLDTVLYFVLTLYADVLRPGIYGTKFWQHCCTSIKARFSCCNKNTKQVKRLFGSEVSVSSTSPQKVHDVIFTDVTMRYGTQSSILTNVSMHIVERKRTAIVGPPGGGKTVISGLISGAYPPSSGTVMVSGNNAFTERNETRSLVSLCPDQNLLCSHITVVEHLLLIGYLRGHRLSDTRRMANKILASLELQANKHEFPDDLVAVQKRKLCIALALIVNSPIIILDEPTSGMDQDMRVQVWKFLKSYCHHETVLLLTSTISEAYYFAERIALLTNGRILGASTTEQLESSLKIGYHVQLKLEPMIEPAEVFAFVQKHVAQSEKLERHSTRFQLAFELADNRDSKSDLQVPESIKDRGMSSGSDVFYDALSKVPTIDETDFPDFDYYEFDNPGATKNALFVLLPKSCLKEFSNFFSLLEDSEVKKEQGIQSYTFFPYSIDQAYQELEEYMRLNEATKSFDLNTTTWLSEINKHALEESLTARLDSKCCQRFLSQFYKRVGFIISVWLHIIFQFLASIVLFLVVLGATNESFDMKLESIEIDDSLNRFHEPTFLIRQLGKQCPSVPLCSNYKYLAPPALTVEVDSFEKYIESKGGGALQHKLASVYIGGLEIEANETEATAMFSPVAFHAAPISLNMLLNAYLQLILTNYSIKIIAQPIESSTEDLLKFYDNNTLNFDNNPCYSLAIVFGLGFFCFTSFFIVQPLTEKCLRLKRLQLNTGLKPFIYWISFFIWDSIFVMIFAAIIVGILYYVPTHPAFRKSDFMINCFGFFTIAGMSSIVLAYVASYVFLQPKSSYFAMLSFNEVAGLFLFVATTLLPESELSCFIIRSFCRLLQPYNVISGIFNLFSIGIHNSRCQLMGRLLREAICDLKWQKKYHFQHTGLDDSCCRVLKKSVPWKHRKRYWNYPEGTTRNFYDGFMFDVVVLILHGIIGVILMTLRELGWHRKHLVIGTRDSKFSLRERPLDGSETDDDLISLDRINKNHFRVEGVSKQFFLESKVLHDVSFYVAPGNLLSIVGPPKSSKTILLHILTGFLKETSGKFFFGALQAGQRGLGTNYLKYVGFAPSLHLFGDIPHMKGIALLRLFGRLRGVPGSELNRHVKKWTNLLGLKPVLNLPFEYCTNSNLQKITLAMAFIGDPPMLIFDEPLNGLDPFTKRQFWIITDYLRNKLGRIVIIATPSMKDIEHRSTKFLFLINGEVECYMPPEQIRLIHRPGFRFCLHFKEGVSFNEWSIIQNRIGSDFPTSSLQKETLNSLEYKINVSESELKLSEMFQVCQAIYEEFNEIVVDYDLSEENIQHIYETFAQRQRPYSKPINAKEEFYRKYC